MSSVLLESQPATTATPIPRLENGDRLTRKEFERRYQAMPNVKKAELIEGIVYMPSPARHRKHGKPQLSITSWLGQYIAFTPKVDGSDNATVRLDLDNEPQPDALLRLLPEHGGQTRLSEDDFLEGAPEFIVEISSSSASYDKHQKKDAYRRNGVQEYLIWLTNETRLEWWRLNDGVYEEIQPDNDGFLKSRVFPGLWLDAEALLQGNLARVFEVVQLGVTSDAHRAFVSA